MKTESMLADVFASANEKLVADTGEKGTAPVAGSQQETETMADKTAPAAVQPKTETVDDLKAAYPALCTQIAGDAAKEAAAAERARIQGILSLPAAGHTKLVTDAIGDGASTRAQLAERIVDAETATRGKVQANLQAAETVAAIVKPALTAGGGDGAVTVPQNSDGWKAEYEASAALQDEFASATDYVAFKSAEKQGRVRILHGKKSA